MAKIDTFLRIMQENGASDLHLSTDCEPMLRINGKLEKAKHRPLNGDEVRLLIYELLSDVQIKTFEADGELDCAYTVPGVARFRINVFRKHPGISAAFWIIPHEVTDARRSRLSARAQENARLPRRLDPGHRPNRLW